MHKFPRSSEKHNLRSLDHLQLWLKGPLKEVRYDIEESTAISVATNVFAPAVAELTELGRLWLTRTLGDRVTASHAEEVIDRLAIARYEKAQRTDCGGLLC